MKNLLVLLLILITFQSVGQIKLRGRVLSVTTKELCDTLPHKVIKFTTPTMAFFHLSDEKFFINGSFSTPIYELFDKDTTTIDGSLIISYYSIIKEKVKLVVASEVMNEKDVIEIAIFDMNGDKRYVEYLCRIGK